MDIRRSCSWLLFAVTLLSVERIALGGAIHGNVKTQAGEPIARVNAILESRVRRAGQPFATSTTVTDKEGAFRFEDAPPGSYNLLMKKQTWSDASQVVTVAEDVAVTEVEFVMELTLLYRVMGNIQIGSLSYVIVFGLLILVANFFIAPRPATGVSVLAWCVVFVAITVAWAKVHWNQALILSSFGVLAGLLLQRFGGRIAKHRVREEEDHKQAEQVARQLERQSIESLVGKEGIAVTDLKACGTIEIEGRVISARAVRGYIPQDTPVVVRKVDGGTPAVESK